MANVYDWFCFATEGPDGGVVLTFADITSQKEMEQVSADRFALAFHAGPMAASIVRRDDGHFLSEHMQDKVLLQFAGRTSPKEAAEQGPSIARLSDRELEVFELHGRGLTTREMAAAIDISPKTVATHRGRIKTKLGIESTPELMRRAVLWIESEKPDAAGPARRRKG